jgi:hypothetical protein
MRKNNFNSQSLLIREIEVEVDPTRVVSCSLHTIDESSILDTIGIGIFLTIGIDIGCDIREYRGRRMTIDHSGIGCAIPLIISPSECAIPVADSVTCRWIDECCIGSGTQDKSCTHRLDGDSELSSPKCRRICYDVPHIIGITTDCPLNCVDKIYKTSCRNISYHISDLYVKSIFPKWQTCHLKYSSTRRRRPRDRHIGWSKIVRIPCESATIPREYLSCEARWLYRRSCIRIGHSE